MDITDYIWTFLTDFMTILGEMAPYLLLGFLFAGLLHAFVAPKNIERYFSGSPFLSSLRASFLGIPLPLCSCGVIPTGAALYKNGASKGGTVSFLISTPQTGVDSMLATFSLLGLPFAIIRPIAALITGVTGGFITGKVTVNEIQEKPPANDGQETKRFSQKIVDVFRYGFVEFIQDISKWLIIGLVAAAVISSLVPDEFFDLMAVPPLLQMLLILVVSIPLYICATGSIPLAAVLILKGISPGAAFVLLMAGPATNAATITMIGKVLGRKSLIAYLATIVVGALGSGLLIDYVLPTNWFTSMAEQHLGHEHNMLAWWEIASGVLLAFFIINGYWQKYRKSKPKNIQTMEKQNSETITVEGMTCNHCKSSVENGLSKLTYVKSARVDLPNNTVTIEGDNLELQEIRKTIDDLGFTCKY